MVISKSGMDIGPFDSVIIMTQMSRVPQDMIVLTPLPAFAEGHEPSIVQEDPTFRQ